MEKEMAMTAPRVDLYRFIHKGIRRKLFGTIALAGTTDTTDDFAQETLRKEVRDLVRILRAHAAHEERFIHPLLKNRLPQAFRELEQEHAAGEAGLEGLLEPSGRTYELLNRFAAEYLDHLDREEAIMPRLREVASEDELRGILAAFKASRSPSEGLEDVKLILPALTPTERAGMLDTIQTQAPSAVFHDVCSAAKEVLDAASWVGLCRRLGISAGDFSSESGQAIGRNDRAE
jgi:hemerythrin superfamily protein